MSSNSTFNVGDKVYHSSRKNKSNKDYVAGEIKEILKRKYLVKFEDNDQPEICTVEKLWIKAVESNSQISKLMPSITIQESNEVGQNNMVSSDQLSPFKAVQILDDTAEENYIDSKEETPKCEELDTHHTSEDDQRYVQLFDSLGTIDQDLLSGTAATTGEPPSESNFNLNSDPSSVGTQAKETSVIPINLRNRNVLLDISSSFEEVMFPSVKDGSFSMPLQTPYTDFFNASGIIMYTKLRHPTLNGAVFPGDILYADETIAKAVIGFWCGNNGNPVLSVVGSFQLDCEALKLINTQYITIDDLLDNLKGLEDCKGEFNRKMFSGDASKQLYECSQVFMENLNDPHLLEMFNIAENDSGATADEGDNTIDQEVGSALKSKVTKSKRIVKTEVNIDNVVVGNRAKKTRLTYGNAADSLKRTIPAFPDKEQPSKAQLSKPSINKKKPRKETPPGKTQKPHSIVSACKPVTHQPSVSRPVESVADKLAFQTIERMYEKEKETSNNLIATLIGTVQGELASGHARSGMHHEENMHRIQSTSSQCYGNASMNSGWHQPLNLCNTMPPAAVHNTSMMQQSMALQAASMNSNMYMSQQQMPMLIYMQQPLNSSNMFQMQPTNSSMSSMQVPCMNNITMMQQPITVSNMAQQTVMNVSNTNCVQQPNNTNNVIHMQQPLSNSNYMSPTQVPCMNNITMMQQPITVSNVAHTSVNNTGCLQHPNNNGNVIYGTLHNNN